ncbi:50S ribosomal protein L25 [Ktedonobacteria bacterium brp13]|nr:50S ribosomal protein L25 [Ktedonobacteria bacterium brp13]
MAEKVIIEATPRTVLGKAAKRLRKEGLIPANVYGHHVEPVAVQLSALAFDRLRRQHDTTKVITLQLADHPEETVLVRHVQHNALSDQIIHIDFTRVDEQERIESKVPLNFTGAAPGVKIHGGVMLHLVDALAIECAASDLVEHLDVDISSLTEIDSTLYARDIPLSSKYTLLADPDEPIVKIAAPRVEEAAEAVTASETTSAGTPAASENTGA